MITDNTALLHLLADIRAAAGDPEGKLMQSELVDHIAELNKKAQATPPQTEWQECDSLESVAEKVCQHLPEGMAIHLSMENGSAWIELELGDAWAGCSHVQESADRTLVEQIDGALRVAKGWQTEPTKGEADE